MKKCLLLLITLMVINKMKAQPINKTITGEYYLSSVMETASGFKLNSDSTFQFFFSYGALDRSGEGWWALKDSVVIFNSRKHPEKDFVLKENKTVAGDFITIKIVDSNPMLVSHVKCSLKTGSKLFEQLTNNDGLVSFPRQPADSIILIFEFCPERSSVFTISNTRYNYFEFGFEPWLLDVFFTNFKLKIKENELTGNHPLMVGSDFHYKKTK